ncbi:Hypothetical predicted protein [Octopus vulgaris]|uniref:Uncharacterized protein n=1 Tax=Octopus vulgaris TaxID=6645 RepID=A0AA36BXM7_OCTVU|nr:Hypothetical predicted protein [Octopus vulgaris]
MLGYLMDGSVEDIAECSGGEIGDFEYDAGIDLGVVVAEDGCGGGIGGCSNGCSGGCEDDSDIDSLCIEKSKETTTIPFKLCFSDLDINIFKLTYFPLHFRQIQCRGAEAEIPL